MLLIPSKTADGSPCLFDADTGIIYARGAFGTGDNIKYNVVIVHPTGVTCPMSQDYDAFVRALIEADADDDDAEETTQ